MSKRDKGASLSTYLDEGYAPEAVVNYLCLLGWSPKNNREKVSVQEVVELFDLPQILRHNARFDINKLHWLNGEYIRSMTADRFYELAIHALGKVGITVDSFPPSYVKAALDTCREKVKLFTEVPNFTGFYFKAEVQYSTETIREFGGEAKDRLARLRDAFAKLSSFDVSSLESSLKQTAADLGIKAGLLVHPLRMAVTGSAIGPSLYHLLEVLGKDRVLARMDQAVRLATA